MSLTTAVERLIGRLKSDPGYGFDRALDARELRHVLWYRALQLLRGLPVRWKLHRSQGLLFAGRRVVVEHGYRITAGPNLILDDDVFLSGLSSEGIALGRNVSIHRGAIVVCTGIVKDKGVGLRVGDYSAIGARNFLGAQGGITIGNHVILGPGVMIYSEDHDFDDLDLPIRQQGTRRQRVTIEDDCWIGAGTIVLKGVTIGSGSVIAAGAVVNRDVPPRVVAAGVPARVVKTRGPGEDFKATIEEEQLR